MKSLFPPLADGTRQILQRLPVIIEKAFPLPARFRSALPRDVAELSRLLTSGREDRGSSYLGKDALLSAYLRYFLPWNIYRLSRLFGSLPLGLEPGDSVNDLGSGPLTLAASLWISRPDLRAIPLEFRCLDKTAAVLEAGKKFFAALATAVPPGNGDCPWTIRAIKGEIKKNGTLSTEIRGKRAALSAAVNVYNEIFWDFSPADSAQAGLFAEKQARLLSSLTESAGSIFVAEPGIPRSGEFISQLRSALIREGRSISSPCTHEGPCPLPGSRLRSRIAHSRPAVSHCSDARAKWCHFAFDTIDAPAALHKLSAAAQLPKERAVMSFILAGPAAPAQKDAATLHSPIAREPSPGLPVKIRVISDCFPVNALPLNVPSLNAPSGNSASSPNEKIMEKHPRKIHKTAENKRRAVSWGRYGCSERGLILITGSREHIASSLCGSEENLPILEGVVDGKSGALTALKE